MTVETPKTLDELNSLISHKYLTLSKRLKEVAQYLLDNPSSAALDTIAVIAEKAEVQPSTLIRFSNALGFSGFSEMQKLFRQQLLIESPSYTERIRKTTKANREKNKDNPHALFQDFSMSNSIAIEELSKSIPKKDFDKAIKLLISASSIHIVGVRRSFPIASYLAYSLRHCDKRAFLIDCVGGMHSEQTNLLTKGDIVIAISYPPYAPETQNAVKAAQEKNIPTIVITDNQLSPLTPLASICFHVKESEVFSIRSLCSSLCLAQALTIGLASALDSKQSKKANS